MGNLVTKKEALEALRRIFNSCEEIDNHLPEEEQSGYKMYPDYNIIWLYLTSPEKHGKWIDGAADFTNGNKTHECSYCGGYIDMHKGGADDYYFCPYCGARMGEE